MDQNVNTDVNKGIGSGLNTIKYIPKGVCSKFITVEIEDNIIKSIDFKGGCNGNAQGLTALAIGLPIDEVIEKLKGISCMGKGTSCPDQLAQCLTNYLETQRG